MRRGYKLGKVCPCGAPVSDKSQSGLCRPCFMVRFHADAKERAQRRAAAYSKRYKEDPEFRARHREAAKRAGRTRVKLYLPQLQEVMRTRIQPLSMTPESLARRDNELNARRVSEAKMAWCPPEYRDEYRRLVRSKKWPTAKAKAFILDKAASIAAIRSGQTDSALHWLNRIAPTKRLDDGNYRYGNTILSPGQLIERAQDKGWKPTL